jgi:acyl-coenzyme A thioesterase PaaI-like protein
MDAAQLEAEGWQRLPTQAFSAAIGPTFMRGEPGARTVALPTSPAIINDHGRSVHGGALMTFADMSLGLAVADLLEAPMMSTVQLQYQFAGAVSAGSLVTSQPEVVRRTRQLVFVRALFEADGKVIGSADGIFRVFDTPQQ